MLTPVLILVVAAVACAGAAMVPTWPEKYLAPAGVIFLAVAVLVLGGGK